jgi:hypothetical protein
VNDCSITRSIAGNGPPSHKPLRVKQRIARTIPTHHQSVAIVPDFVRAAGVSTSKKSKL